MKKLNVIWILGESVRNYSGTERYSKYPLFDKLKKTDNGVICNNVVVAAPSTIMSQSSMLTGIAPTYLSRTFADFNYDQNKWSSIYKILTSNGYTSYAGWYHIEGNSLFKKLQPTIKDEQLPQGITHNSFWTSEDLNKVLQKLIDDKLESPFFLMLNYNNQDDTNDYIEKAYNLLNDKGLLENTLFLFCPDHGWPDNNRNSSTKRHESVVTDANILINLYLQYPNASSIIKEKEIDQLIASTDILPTILDILEIPKEQYQLQGQSILPLITEETNSDAKYTRDKFRVDQRFLLQKGRVVCIRGQRYKYVINIDQNTEELFDTKNDPDEKNNISKSEKEIHQAILKEFQTEFQKNENQLIEFHQNDLITAALPKISKLLNENKKDHYNILLLGSAHPLFIKALIKTVQKITDNYSIDLIIQPTAFKKVNLDAEDNIKIHFIEIEEKQYEHTKSYTNELKRKEFKQYSGKINVPHLSIDYQAFLKKRDQLSTNDYDLAIVPLDNPYGVGHQELSKIAKSVNPKNIIYLDYNMNEKKPTHWLINGLKLLNAKRGHYLKNPKSFLQEIKRYFYSVGIIKNDPVDNMNKK